MEKEVTGYIDWEGVLHECGYGQHSNLALTLAKKLNMSSIKVDLGLVKIMRLGFSYDSTYLVYLPKSFNQKQIDKLNELKDKTTIKSFKLAIEDVFEKLKDYKDIFDEKINPLETKETLLDDFMFSDYGITGEGWI